MQIIQELFVKNMRKSCITIAIHFYLCYNKCVLNNRQQAVIAPNFVRGAQIPYKTGICASHFFMSSSFCPKGQNKVQEKI